MAPMASSIHQVGCTLAHSWSCSLRHTEAKQAFLIGVQIVPPFSIRFVLNEDDPGFVALHDVQAFVPGLNGR